MLDQVISIPSAFLASSLPDRLPAPKFLIGQRVCWFRTATQDFGRVAAVFYAVEVSIQAIGYHYAVQLDRSSPSTALGIDVDWGYEADLSLIPVSTQWDSDIAQSESSQDANS